LIIDGAISDEKGEMTGSMLVMRFETEDELAVWVKPERRINGWVRQKIEIKPFRVADI
jgi:uncharacterized protein YciI